MNSKTELWKPVPGHVNYEVSNTGKVRTRGHVRTYEDGSTLSVEPQDLDCKFTSGYKYVWIDGEPNKVHRLVAETFLPNPDGCPWVRHKDNDIRNNNVDNLEWSSPSIHLPDDPQNGIKVKSMKDNKVFSSIRDAANWYGIDYDKLYYAIKRNKSIDGIHVIEC